MSDISLRLSQLRLRDLSLLELIAQHGSLRQVAEVLHVTQPAVTQALQGLERAFGVDLVQRERRGVRLTEAGHAARARLRTATLEVAAAQEAASAPQVPLLRIGTSSMASLDATPSGLSLFRKRLPRARLVVTETSVPQLWRMLGDGDLDAVVSRLPSLSQGEGLPEGLSHHVTGLERLVLIAARDHPLANRRPKVEMLVGQAWALPPAGSMAASIVEGWFTRAGLRPPETSVTSISFLTNLRLAATAGLLTVAPESAARSHAQMLKIKIIPTPWERTVGELVFAWRTAGQDNPHIALLRDCFAKI